MCGVAGIVGNASVNQELHEPLTILQHRGQHAAGITTYSDDKLFLRKSNGLVRDVFHRRHMRRLEVPLGLVICVIRLRGVHRVLRVAEFRGVTKDVVLSEFGQGGSFVRDHAVEAGLAERLATLEEVITGLSCRSTRLPE